MGEWARPVFFVIACELIVSEYPEQKYFRLSLSHRVCFGGNSEKGAVLILVHVRTTRL